jgi:hypothetical protein
MKTWKKSGAADGMNECRFIFAVQSSAVGRGHFEHTKFS